MQNLNTNSSAIRITYALLAALVFIPLGVWQSLVEAAAPQGNDWFEIHADPFTGKDNTGDGSTGDPADLNYFYVGQTFTANAVIKSNGTNAANLWVDFDPALSQPSNLSGAAIPYFNQSTGLTIDNGRLKATGYNLPNAVSSGPGNFATFNVTLQKPTASNYGTGAPAVLHLNTGAIGQTTESNIALNGTDLLDDAEDFRFHVWADTKKPYALNPQPANAAVNVPVTFGFSFQLRDSLNGEGNDSGVGTGVNIDSAQASITANDGSGPVNLKPNSVHTCSGVWGSNLCEVAITPLNTTSFAGDTRKWKYGTLYTISIANYDDLASANQNQLGDANGPNRMNPKTFTFTTEADTVLPQLSDLLPVPDSVDQPLNSVLSFKVFDRKTYPDGMSGSGVNADACRITVASASTGSVVYKKGDAGVTVNPIDYGFHFSMDPVADFGSNETVTVKISDCADLAGNKIPDRQYTFKTLVMDTDRDGVLDSVDNCPLVVNPDQKNTTKTWKALYVADPVKNVQYKDVVVSPLGDACNPDIDGDTVLNATDNCPLVINTDQADLDLDKIGDLCDDDIDGDTVKNDTDNCPLVVNTDQKNTTKTWRDLFIADPVGNAQYATVVASPLGDACNPDIDGDTVLNATDNCPLVINTDQKNTTNELHALFVSDPVLYAQYKDLAVSLLGDVCNPDIDGDLILNATDNCPITYNPDQADLNQNGTGDACEGGLVVFNIKAKPQKRFHTALNPNLGLTATLKFYNTLTKTVSLEDTVTLANDGTVTYTTTTLNPGTYNIGLKGEGYLTKVIRDVSITNRPTPALLDFTVGNTAELFAGDLQAEDKVNSFDIVRILKVYGATGAQAADFVLDGRVNAPDITLLILNYLKLGDLLQ